jgi:serine/threonine-protein kinase HipA
VVHKVAAKEPISDLERRVITAGGSFGGAKPKAPIEIDGQQWLIKFFDNGPIDAPLIVVALLGENAVAVQRFDRDGDHRIRGLSAATAGHSRQARHAKPLLSGATVSDKGDVVATALSHLPCH